jgi:nucleoside-diphosphate-sugar epimerase
MRILILGCGYIGLAVGRALISEGHEVIGVTRSGDSADLLTRSGITSKIADCSTPDGARDACGAGADTVIFSVSSNGGDYEKTYLNGMHSVMAALRLHPPSMFFYTSSTSVYAQTGGEWVTETSLTQPPHSNGKTLLLTEQSLATASNDRFTAYALRLSGIYGPGRHMVLDKLRDGSETISGDEDQWLNQIHREDVVQAIRVLMKRPEQEKFLQIFNVSDFTPVRRRDYVAWVCQQLGRPVPKFVEESGESRRRKRFQPNRRINNAALKAVGWTPKHPSFREGLASELRA